jgi:hypothetical protein
MAEVVLYNYTVRVVLNFLSLSGPLLRLYERCLMFQLKWARMWVQYTVL